MSDFVLDEFMTHLMSDDYDNNQEFIPIISDELNPNDTDNLPESLPILPLRNAVLFPGNVIPITVGREKSLNLIKKFSKGGKLIGTLTQKDGNVEDPSIDEMYKTGTVAQILRVLEMPDGTTSVILQGKGRFNLIEQLEDDPFFVCKVENRAEKTVEIDDEIKAIVSNVKEMALKIIKMSTNIPNEASFALKNITNPSFLINFVCSNSDSESHEKQQLLEIDSVRDRALLLLKFLNHQIQMLEIKNDINSKVKNDIEQQQRDYFLQQQMKTIQDELGDNSHGHEIEKLKEQAAEKKWSEEVQKTFQKELGRLERMNPQVGEFSVQLSYLQTLLELPWEEFSIDNFDLVHAQEVLDTDHFGLEKVKERIIEHLAVLKLKNDMKSPIICLYGPPGVGKTSLGKSIATALNRKYSRISLGGLHDEAEIRGHRRTYIGAMPGRIIKNIKKVKTANPVFILDEIDKVGKSAHGDPESALLEVLDPEQNSAFHDNYLELDYDLSNVMFIATANNIANISQPLLDRMEMINVSGYIVEEKIEIARRHLLPQNIERHGLEENQLELSNDCLEYIIENHSRESGVRELNKKLAKVCRYIARKVASEQEYDSVLTIENLKDIFGPPEYSKDAYEGNEFAGVVTGLAWTAAGGDILYIETSLSKGKGALNLTGNLGNVMKESASIALQYIKSNAEDYGINPDIFNKYDIHLHVPEGAIPKDGPSAGITMATALVSALTQRKVKKKIAMTGEITLRGKVLPVGGIKEKILAAKRADIKYILLCEENRKNVENINEIYLKGLEFIYVKTVQDVLEFALLQQKVSNPKKFEI